MARKKDDHLDDSWIVNDATDDGDISWAGEDTPSEDENVQTGHQQPLKQTHSKPYVRRSQELSFIMPSIEDVTDRPRQRVSRKQEQRSTPVRDTKSRTLSARSTPSRIRSAPQDDPTPPEFTSRALAIVGSFFLAIFDILSDALRLLKKPISWILAGYAVLVFFQFAQNLLTSSVYSALSPICRIPGTGFLDLPMCRPYGANLPKLAAGTAVPEPEFDTLMQVQGQFESIMEDTASGVSLPMDMKRSETSIRDLRQVIRFSEIPSKHELLLELDGFIETARIASYDLQRFNSHVGRGVDIVLSTARWTQRVLDDMDHEQEQKDQRGILPSFISDTLLAPFKPIKLTHSRLLDQYIQHTHIVSGEIEKLLEEAQTLYDVLQNLENRLETIHSISIRDNIQVQGTKDEILADIWSYVGGNQKKKKKVDRQIALLAGVSEYRRSAFKHVADTIVKLQSMGAELEELRSRVGSAAALKDAGVEHIPLAVHVDNIKLGVERLEIGRQRAKELEHERTRRILDRAEADYSQKELKYTD
ncbi:hypothetical protein LTR64_003198 [Lithohypha guttulata]|uniref:uncharacterized protein n=1 Tax=Lithohypha guttulata TaxID=1690604 RepID=UPI002DE1822E|nr:hypothetical protein LTR51_000580 [Lithohypha guttulata]